MKDIYKNPMFYYVLIPVLLLFWPLFVWGVYLPRTEQKWENEKKYYEKSKDFIDDILTIDKERLEFSDSQNNGEEFDYAVAIDRIARKCGIPASKYSISSKPARISGGQKTQSAMVVLRDVSISDFSHFLSTVTIRWANLQCERVKISRKKGLDDIWKVDLDLKYYF
jgi:hypothetical protein